MQGMGDLRALADTIMQGLADGSLPVTSDESQNSGGKTPTPFSAPPGPRFSTTEETLTAAQLQRRKVIMLEVVQRYIFDKHLDPLLDDELRAVVRSYDQLFTHAGVPTDRIRDVYAEAMAQHGQYLLRVDDYLRAWERVRPKEGDGADLRPMGERGSDCAICGGTGRVVTFVPFDFRNPAAGGREVEKPCPYRHETALAVAARAEVGGLPLEGPAL
jgi:hypothetical protein